MTRPLISSQQPFVEQPAAGLPSAFSFAITRAMGVVVVTAHGSLDASSGAVLKAVLVDLIDGQGNLAVVVDAHDIDVVDPSCLGVLVAAAGSAARRGGELTFADPSEAMARALEATGLAGAITVTRHPRLRALPTPARRGAVAHHPAGGRQDPTISRHDTHTDRRSYRDDPM